MSKKRQPVTAPKPITQEETIAALRHALTVAAREIERLRSEIDFAADERAAIAKVAATLEAERDEARAELAEQTAGRAAVTAQLHRTIERYVEAIGRLIDERDEARAERDEARSHAAGAMTIANMRKDMLQEITR